MDLSKKVGQKLFQLGFDKVGSHLEEGTLALLVTYCARLWVVTSCRLCDLLIVASSLMS
jgi:hypothetical protein